MSEENKENPTVKNNQIVNDLLMKPFSLGWTREVVKRLVTNNRTPNCDIYYFSPTKKRLRSLAEVKSNLTDGLSAECFSFKRKPLGLSPDLETIRDAKARRKGTEKFKEDKISSREVKKQSNSENEVKEIKGSENETKKNKKEVEDKDTKSETGVAENVEKLNTNSSVENQEMKEDFKKKIETKSRKVKSDIKQFDKNKTISNKKKTKTRSKAKTKPKSTKSTKSVKLQSVKKRKTVLKKVMSAKQAKQAKLVASRKVLKGIINNKVSSLKHKITKTQTDKKAPIKTRKNSLKLKAGKKPVKNGPKKAKNEIAKEPETNETDKKSSTKDLKSIVKKNIVKYREMREKQKLGVKTSGRSPLKKIPAASVSRSRLEPVSKNKQFYLKPLEKGWRRELVYRSNCARAGQQADVYYFHPSGKKLRSFREISENLTSGLSIECFTFRKEPIGCGEPSEVIRNARSHQKN